MNSRVSLFCGIRLSTLIVCVAMLSSAEITRGQEAMPSPLVRGPYLQVGTPTSIIVKWHTAVSTEFGRVSYGTAPDALTQFVDDVNPVFNNLETGYSATITGLVPGTKYYYAVGIPTEQIAGGDEDHFFKTAPVAGKRTPFRFWALGDSGTANDNARAVRDAYYKFTGDRHTDLWLMLGDNANSSGSQVEYQNAVFSNMYEDMLRKSALFSTIGNRDAVSADSSTQTGPYYDIFDMPSAGEGGGLPSGTEAYYSFDWGNVHFVCLDSEGSSYATDGAMLTWLDADLAATDQDWIIVYWHQPPYSKGAWDSDYFQSQIDLRASFVPLLESHGVDLVLNGHCHSYERSMLIDGHYGDSSEFDPMLHAKDAGDGKMHGDGAYRKDAVGAAPNEGTVYVVSGSSGCVVPSFFGHPVMATHHIELASLVVDVNGLQIDVRSLTSEGEILDEFTMVKGGVSPAETIHEEIAHDADWRFDDSGTDPGATWVEATFDDSAWPMSQAPFGGAGGVTNTTLTGSGDPTNDFPTVYFRRTFSADQHLIDLDNLRLQLHYDQGVIVWLNGVEIARCGMPDGPVDYLTWALPPTGQTKEIINLADHRDLLVVGANHLAVEIHRSAPDVGDVLFSASLAFDEFTPFLSGACAEGNLDDQEAVLTLNGTDGGLARSVDIEVLRPITFGVDTPSTFTGPNGAHFLIFVNLAPPENAAPAVLPFNTGTMCFTPILLDATAASSVLVGTYDGGTGGTLPGHPTPWSFSFPDGIPFAGFTFGIQGVVQTGAIDVRVTNAVRGKFVP